MQKELMAPPKRNKLWADIVAELEARHRAQKGPRWHLVQLAPGEREKRTAPSDEDAVVRLADLTKRFGFDLYCPMLRVLAPVPRRSLSRADRKAGVKLIAGKLEPLLPRYRFVRFDAAEGRWPELSRIAGVAGLVVEQGQPVPIADALIASMRAAEVDGAIPGQLPAIAVFKLGAIVRVTDPDSPWVHMMGAIKHIRVRSVEDVDVADRLTVTLRLFGRFTPVDLFPDQVEPA
jgi:transcription antitermination factor NusG